MKRFGLTTLRSLRQRNFFLTTSHHTRLQPRHFLPFTLSTSGQPDKQQQLSSMNTDPQSLLKMGFGAVVGMLAYHAVSAATTTKSKRSFSTTTGRRTTATDDQNRPYDRDQDMVRDAYARTVTKKDEHGCCQTVGGVTGKKLGYSQEDLDKAGFGDSSTMLGCGTPVELAALQPGEVVLDLGCGAGIDCYISALRVGKTGGVIGVDMTPAMLAEARRNAKNVKNKGDATLGVAPLSFRLGEIEHLPVADNEVDCIISNCVINLSPDKPQVYAEMFRALRPGGRIAISDVLKDIPELPEHLRTAEALAC